MSFYELSTSEAVWHAWCGVLHCVKTNLYGDVVYDEFMDTGFVDVRVF